ncbi:hypothetical protein [Sphingomonas qomolangmaensis]|uniref:Type I phosphodiesterase / nucleotide pyrophosphatase n=1 Tax=Sphingomonas qomolangmaensis TaxID=2918765 RepID=A0ABY5L6V8_9SPHN|nr:hypothetical protein [Sphingomonas qomolangmaensis]UUL82177.1 hypothetical protein NMP03_13440 [Sphingomonas qomolangmaensis]
MPNVVSLEMNEINFEFVKSYVAKGELPHFAELLAKYELTETVAEEDYRLLEPWIQWPTVYTGMSYAEHGVFRLGDIVGTTHEQVWEALEARGVSVGAISPINGANRCAQADFFVPDPWTATPVTGDEGLKTLSGLVGMAVNGNATGGASLASLGPKLMPFVLRFARPTSWGAYAACLAKVRKYKWAKAAFLDRFLADVFLKLRAKHGTRYASLFLNAGAHIQHHHLFEAGVYQGENRNPDWYSTAGREGVDPMLFIYRIYDGILRDVLALADTRVLITTGLSQTANGRTKYQYRFNDHVATLHRMGVGDFAVNPRMSRDFLLEFPDAASATAAAAKLAAFACAGKPFFSIEDRGRSLFCQICYFGPPEGLAEVTADGRTFDIADEISLVSIENGIHQTIGYHIDTAVPRRAADTPARIPLTSVFARTLAIFPGDAPLALAAAE